MATDLEDLVFRNVDDVACQALLNFQCSSDDLNRFLTEDAKSYHSSAITKTTVVFSADNDDVPIAFFSLSSSNVKLVGVEVTDLGLDFKPNFDFYPAILITKFAISKNNEGNGLGKQLIELISAIAYGIDGMAVRILTVDAVPTAVSFYKKCGFTELNIDAGANRKNSRKKTTLMYRDIYLNAS